MPTKSASTKTPPVDKQAESLAKLFQPIAKKTFKNPHTAYDSEDPNRPETATVVGGPFKGRNKDFVESELRLYKGYLKEDQERVKDLIDAKEEITARTKALKAALVNKEKFKEKKTDWRKIFQRILDMEDIEDLKFIPGTNELQFFTGMIKIPYNKKVYPIGKVRVTFTLHDNGHHVVRVLNLTRSEKKGICRCGGSYCDRQHPHAGSGGICFGEMGNSIHNLLSRKMLPEAVSSMIVWLKSINDQESYALTGHWYPEPIKAKKTTKKK